MSASFPRRARKNLIAQLRQHGGSILGLSWEVGDELSPGAQAHVFKVKKTGDPDDYVLKIPKLSAGGRDKALVLRRFVTEIGAIKALNDGGCPNIIKIVDRSSDANFPWFVMPYYKGGAMRSRDGFAERFQGNITRVLQIGIDIALALEFMSEASPGFIHRDIKCRNIFFAEAGGAAILGDFGLVFEQAEDDALLTPVTDQVGPRIWRPPELRSGGGGQRSYGSDVYLLGGVMYEALTDGEALAETERFDGSFAHLDPRHSIARFCNDDPRAPHVNELLRGMFRRNPSIRFSPKTVIKVCRELVEWSPPNTAPGIRSMSGEAEEAAEAFRIRIGTARRSQARAELLAVCTRIADSFSPRGSSAREHASVVVEPNSGDGPCTDFIQAKYPDADWAAVRIKADFAWDGGRILYCSYAMLLRNASQNDMVGLLDENANWRLVFEGPPASPGLEGAISRECINEVERLDAKLAVAIKELAR